VDKRGSRSSRGASGGSSLVGSRTAAWVSSVKRSARTAKQSVLGMRLTLTRVGLGLQSSGVG
jgi:hypothetical protein